MGTYKAFVISPIGDPGTDGRRHADWVLDNIIRPACAQLAPEIDIEVKRSDEETKPGLIMEQAIHSIMHHRIVFAVLACDRPNVYYELALAVAAGRPVIVLRHDREHTHFDIKDVRAIDYSYPLEDPAVLQKKVNQVAGFVKSVLQIDDYARKVFTGVDALGRGFREYAFVDKFREINIPSYSRVFHEAREFIGMQGISLWHFTRPDFDWYTPKDEAESFFDLIRSKILFDAVSVRIVMMHPANPALPHLIKFDKPQRFSESIESTRDEISLSFKYWSKLKAELDAVKPERDDGRKGALQIIRLTHGVVNYRLTLTDREAILSPYFNVFKLNSLGAALRCSKGTAIYDHLWREFIDRVVSNDAAVIALKEHGTISGYAPPSDTAA